MTEKKIERTYVIPIRRTTVKVQRWKRAKKAIWTIRKFMKRHMKSDDILIGQELNELIWSRGGKSVPGKVQVAAKLEEGIVSVNLVGAPLPGIKKEEKKEEKAEKTEEKKEEKKHEIKEEKKHEPVKEEKPAEKHKPKKEAVTT
jgi:large subunit ribosomal protein L31e